MYRLIFALRDDAHGIYGYTLEIVEKGVWRDLPLEEVRKNYTKIEGAYIEPRTQLVTAEGCRVVYVGTDYTNPATTGGRLHKGYNDLYTWSKKHDRLDIIAAYEEATKQGKNPVPLSEIPYHSYAKKIWLVCPVCKHLFEASPVYLTTRKNFCPTCAARSGKSRATISGVNCLATWCKENNRPDIAADYSPDNPRKITEIAAFSHDRVKWVCHKCGYTWESPVLNRTSQTGDCAACTARGGKGTRLVLGVNDLETWCSQNNRLDILQAWSPLNQLSMNQVAAKTDEIKVHLSCSICGSDILITPLQITLQRNPALCSHCKPQGTSAPQVALYNVIKKNFPDTLYRFKINGFEADIYIPSLHLAIEYNGIRHFDVDTMVRDDNKAAAFESSGVELLVIQEYPDKSASLGLDSNIKNRINLWYKLNTSKELYEFVLRWINEHYRKSAGITDEIYKDSITIAQDTMTRRNVLNSIVQTHPQIAAEWDYEKNGNLRPEMFTRGSHQEVYWICTKCSVPHSYIMSIHSRCCKGRGCTIKAGKRVQAGLNDLVSVVPNFVKYCWDFEANAAAGIDLAKVSRGSKKMAHFKCPFCGYKWVVNLYSIVGFRLRENSKNPPKCPHCSKELPFK